MTTENNSLQQRYRLEAREWLAGNMAPLEERELFATLHWMPSREKEDQHHLDCQQRQGKLYEAGYAGITVPKEYGGHGGEAWMQRIFREESVGYQVHTGFYNSIISMALPALMRHGTDDQKIKHIPTLISGEVSWCQLFSEPGAGSDLAGLATRAEIDGDEFVIHGQKVWNSAAMYADMGILLVRTNPSAQKHEGITFLLFDMRQSGVEVRPLIQAHGAGHFAEVFLDGAKCHISNVLGEIDHGWGPARVVMSNESAMIGGASGDNPSQLIELARDLDMVNDSVLRQRLSTIFIRNKILKLMSEKISVAARKGQLPPIHPSIVKLYVAENRRLEGDLAQQILGAAGVTVTHRASEWAMEVLHSRYPISIGGGTDEVHHNNLGEQALGLPRDIRVDRGIPWKDIPKG
ncbi:MAG: acyl-CoA dehydrogenase family protein [Actinomycetota bacterium]|nr:acyl-CoA dehydrogenase family protein [Actinomycetota bacterium]